MEWAFRVGEAEAEASIATMVTSMQEETASATSLVERCPGCPLRNCLNELLFMHYKFAGSNHASTYVDTTVTQIRRSLAWRP